MERDWIFCQNKHGFLKIGSTCIIPRGQNTISHAFKWYEVKNRGEVGFFISISNMRDEMFYVLVCPMHDICSETDAFTWTLMLTAAGTLMELLLSLKSMTYMELCFKSSSPTFSVLFFQFLNGIGESWGRDLSVSTGERLQDSIMDEHILVLCWWVTVTGAAHHIRMLLVCGPMNSFSFFTQLLPIIAEQICMRQL